MICKHNTSNDPVFAVPKCAVNGYRKELAITSIQSDYKCTNGLKVQKWEFSNWLCLRGDVARLHDRHQWQHDPPRLTSTQSTSTTNTWVHSPLSVRASSHCTLHRMAQVRAVSVISQSSTCAHDVCGSPSTLISPFSSSFPLAPPVALLPLPWGSLRACALRLEGYGPLLTRPTPSHDLGLLSSHRRSWHRSWLRWSVHNYFS